MTELRELLDIEAHRVHGRPEVLPKVLRRVDRRRRNRRIGTVAVALLMSAAGIVGAFSAFGRPGSEADPAAGGYAGIWPQTSLGEAEIAQSRADHGDVRLTHQLDASLFVHTFARDGLFWTEVAFDPIEDDAAQGSGPLAVSVSGCPFDASPQPQPEGSPSARSDDCPLRAEVTIERLLRRDPTGIWVVTGVTIDGLTPDVHRSPLPLTDTPGPSGFDPSAPEGVGAIAEEFIEARNGSRAVARYLSAGGLRDYEDAEGGLSLYGYAAEAHTLSLWAITEAGGRWRVVVGFQGSDPPFPDGDVIRETLLIGPGSNLLGQSSDWVVLDAERNE